MSTDFSLAKLNEIQRDVESSELIVVGTGLFGCTVAERTANILKKKVTLIEARDHVGGNSFSYKDPLTDIEIHKYGTHIFHTENAKVWSYVKQFANFNDYRHKVVTNSGGKIYSLPVNLFTLTQIFENDLPPHEAEALLGSFKKSNADNFEDLAISMVGEKIYNLFFKGYTKKQWGIDPKNLPAETFTRLPVRYDMNFDYFNDKFQGIPINGYGDLISKMVQNPKIKIHKSSDFFKLRDKIRFEDKLIVFTGPIDRYFNYQFGNLSWRTVDFELETLPIKSFQGIAVKNFSDFSIPYTRIHEYKYLHPERKEVIAKSKTVIAREYSRIAQINDEPYYPVNSPTDREKLLEYRKLQESEINVVFGGRLATYQYLDMHMAIGSALSVFENQIIPRLAKL